MIDWPEAGDSLYSLSKGLEMRMMFVDKYRVMLIWFRFPIVIIVISIIFLPKRKKKEERTKMNNNGYLVLFLL